MKLSVVIATRDRAHYLEPALASLEHQIGAPEFEVVVADNGSSDDTPEVTSKSRSGFTVKYVREPEPNRGKARNRGIEAASGEIVAFCDDDVVVAPGWVAAHVEAHRTSNRVVNGPILNVPSYEDRPKPAPTNYSRAFLCTCNASVPKHALAAVNGFDEDFHLYGWEDTELGVRLRERGLQWIFAWDAYLWHIKPPKEDTLEVQTKKVVERARMARRFVEKSPSQRVRLAIGAHPLNLFRGRYLIPDGVLSVLAGAAANEHFPDAVRSIARAQFLDGLYTRELVRALDE